MKQEKKLTKMILSLLLLSMSSSVLEAKDKWGTPTLNDKYRPQQGWIQRFTEIPNGECFYIIFFILECIVLVT